MMLVVVLYANWDSESKGFVYSKFSFSLWQGVGEGWKGDGGRKVVWAGGVTRDGSTEEVVGRERGEEL